jgi:hypothetical protein
MRGGNLQRKRGDNRGLEEIESTKRRRLKTANQFWNKREGTIWMKTGRFPLIKKELGPTSLNFSRLPVL